MSNFLSGRNSHEYEKDKALLQFLGIITGAFIVKRIAKRRRNKKNK